MLCCIVWKRVGVAGFLPEMNLWGTKKIYFLKVEIVLGTLKCLILLLNALKLHLKLLTL
jgi:hypothetical protein